jgi:hypothetical protein
VKRFNSGSVPDEARGIEIRFTTLKTSTARAWLEKKQEERNNI